MEVSDQVADCALRHYEKNITNKGKPRGDGSEWTVYAAIVAQRGAKVWVVSAATGTKCTTLREKGFILHDTHAEVLARRGLMRVLWLEIKEKLTLPKVTTMIGSANHEELLEPLLTEKRKFKLRSDICLHLYISDSPCGDASIYATSEGPILYTGAKVIVSPETAVNTELIGGEHQLLNGAPVAREETQLLGKLRSKAGRSNIPEHLRSTSMSCSDKIVKWSILGLQGDLLSKFIPEAVLLSSITVGQDPRVEKSEGGKKCCHQMKALERALSHRIRAVWDHVTQQTQGKELDWYKELSLPSVHISKHTFPAAKSIMVPNSIQSTSDNALTIKKRKRSETSPVDKKISPCGFSLNWQQTDSKFEEIIVGARGIRQGKKPKSSQDYSRLSSRLCRTNLCNHATELLPDSCTTTYQQFKTESCGAERKRLKEVIFLGGPLAGWLCEQNDFHRLDE